MNPQTSREEIRIVRCAIRPSQRYDDVVRPVVHREGCPAYLIFAPIQHVTAGVDHSPPVARRSSVHLSSRPATTSEEENQSTGEPSQQRTKSVKRLHSFSNTQRSTCQFIRSLRMARAWRRGPRCHLSLAAATTPRSAHCAVPWYMHLGGERSNQRAGVGTFSCSRLQRACRTLALLRRRAGARMPGSRNRHI